MDDRRKTKAELIRELDALRARVAALETAAATIPDSQGKQSLHEARDNYHQLFGTMREGYARHEIILDDSGAPCDYRFLQINPAFEEITGLGTAEAVGKTVLELFPDTEQEWIEIYGKVAVTGQPTRFEMFSVALSKHFEVSAYSPQRGQFACVFRDITQRVEDEAALRRSEERFRGVIDNLAAGVAFCRPTEDESDFMIVSLNPTALQRAGEDASQYIGKSVHDALPALHNTKLGEALGRVWASGEPERFPTVLKNARGLGAWFDTFVCCLSVGELVVVFEDRTKERRSQEQARQREKQLQSIFASAPIGIGLIRGNQVVAANDRLAQMLLYQPGELMGALPQQFLSSQELGRAWNQLRANGTASVETELKRSDGTQLAVVLSATPFDPEDYAKGITFTLLDITQRKQNESRIRLEQQVLAALSAGKPQWETIHTILETIQRSTGIDAIGLRLHDGDDYPYYVQSGLDDEFVIAENQLCCRDTDGNKLLNEDGDPCLACLCGLVVTCGVNPELPFFTEYGSFWTNNCSQLLASGELPQLPHLRGRCPREGYESMALIPLVCGEETVGLLQLNDRKAGRFTEDDIAFYEELSASIGVSIAREQDREALRCNEERLHEILDSVGAGVMAIDGETDTVLYANPAAAQLLRADRSSLVGKKAPIVSRRDHADSSPLQSLGSPEVRLVAGDGSTVPVLRTISATELDGRQCLLESFVDLTALREAQQERERLEARLRRSQRLEAIGTLAGGIAHDFNNILYAILGFTELALDDCPEESELRDNLLEITKSGQRAKAIIHQILTFSRQTEEEKMPLRLQSVVKEVGRLLRGSIPSSISILTEVDSDTPCVLANPGQMHQVLMNLCTNAYQAMLEDTDYLRAASRPRRIRISLHPRSIAATEASLFPDLEPGPYVELAIEDTGPGIPAEIQEHILEPYFTTKTKERGTGLGLAIVSGIIQSHEGAIGIDSEVGVGTTFRVLLPVAVLDEEQAAGALSLEMPVSGTENVLFVDDEAAIRRLAEQGLATYGYSVTTASEGTQALELFRKSPESFDIMVTDLTMPGMLGTELAREILLIRADMPIILSTGFVDALDRDTAMAHGIQDIALKPIAPADMARLIERILHPSR